MVKDDLVPMVKQISSSPMNLTSFSASYYTWTDQEQEALVIIVIFVKAVGHVYVRPFPPLGTLVLMLGNEIFDQQSIDSLSPIQKILIQLTRDVFFNTCLNTLNVH